ncbi:MAG TPA: T9SS type A sorting domain-containing protein [Bacteroidota bacterium]|nr:T9SS type A sorting domain-containing protein [Bacteroidota bacterium]
MKHARVLLLVFAAVSAAFGQGRDSTGNYPTVSIHDLQFVPMDSLLVCDSTGGNVTSGAAPLKQTSAYYKGHYGSIDTVEIVGQVIVPPKLVEFTGPGTPTASIPPSAGGFNIVLRDTGAGSGAWSSVFVRPAAAGDTVALYNAGYLGLNPGDIIRLRGYADEFPFPNTCSYTEFVPIDTGAFVLTSHMPDGPLEILGHKPVPPPVAIGGVDTFMVGLFNASNTTNIKFSRGEQYEDAYVQLTNLKVTSVVNATNGTFSMVDAHGNEIAMLDVSKWFTKRAWRPASSTYQVPSIGQNVDTIRGYIACNSGSEAARGYRICPVFPTDIVFGQVIPAIQAERRNPVRVGSADTAVISVKSFQQTGGSVPKGVLIHYSINNGAWQTIVMAGPNPADSTWTGKIVPHTAGTFVKYYCTSDDSLGHLAVLANAAGGSAPTDTSQGFFFYNVLDRHLTVYDIQYTPYADGTSPYLGAVDTIAGVVTADTSDLNLNPTGTTPWYIQNGTAPWNGLWISSVDTNMFKVHKGDSISVSGTVQEFLEGTTGSVGRVTRLGNSTFVAKFGTRPVPPPIVLTTNTFANGSTGEQYEGMLVRFNHVVVTDLAPTASDPTEYAVNDGSGPIVTRSADGKSRYSNVKSDTLFGRTIFSVGDSISFIQGLVYFSFNQYKLVPRGSSDFGVLEHLGTGVLKEGDGIPKQFGLSQNYPNPFNPSTNIEFDLPASGPVSLKIYNILGEEVAVMVDGDRAAGHYVSTFDASRLTSGIYIYRLQSTSGVLARKMVLIK